MYFASWYRFLALHWCKKKVNICNLHNFVFMAWLISWFRMPCGQMEYSALEVPINLRSYAKFGLRILTQIQRSIIMLKTISPMSVFWNTCILFAINLFGQCKVWLQHKMLGLLEKPEQLTIVVQHTWEHVTVCSYTCIFASHLEQLLLIEELVFQEETCQTPCHSL